MKWKTKEGKVLNHYDMETSHIENCIKQLQKRLNAVHDFIAAEECQHYAFSQAQAEEMNKKISSAINMFENELRLREKGKPIGEKFPLTVIQPWEIRYQG